jgi:predicted dinucleotide-binding enzyme
LILKIKNYSMATTKKIAVIGLGNIGKIVAQNLVKGNRAVILASRNVEDAVTLAEQLGSLATASDIVSAMNEADIIVMAVWFNTIEKLFSDYGTALRGKIILDPSNPIAPDDKGGFKKIIGENESGGELNSALLPMGAKLVKALGTLGVASLASAAFQLPEQAVLFYTSDDRSVDEEVDQLILDSGFNPLRIGGLDQSIRIEVFGDLHEFGALGKTVSLSEAKSRV